MSDTYNGWANKFTWLVALWIDNDQGMQEEAVEIVRLSAGEPAPLSVGERIKEWLEEMREQGDDLTLAPSMTTDMLNTAFDFVEWREIGAHYIATAADIDRNT